MHVVNCTVCAHDKICKYQKQKAEVLKLYEHHHPEYPFVMRFDCELFSSILQTRGDLKK